MSLPLELNETSLKRKFMRYSGCCFRNGFILDKDNETEIDLVLKTLEEKEKGVLILGSTGTGKTILMHMLQRIIHPQDASFFVKRSCLDVVIDFNIDGSDTLRQWNDRSVFYDDLGAEDKGVHFGDRVEGD